MDREEQNSILFSAEDASYFYNGPGIYKITCLRSGWVYVGSSVRIRHRFLKHRLELKDNTHSCTALTYCHYLFGFENLEFSLIEKSNDAEEIRVRELQYQTQYAGKLLSRIKRKYKFGVTEEMRVASKERMRRLHGNGVFYTDAVLNAAALRCQKLGKRPKTERQIEAGRKSLAKHWTPERKAAQAELMRSKAGQPWSAKRRATFERQRDGGETS